MAAVTVASFIGFANLVVASCKLADATDFPGRLKAVADILGAGRSIDAALRTTGLDAVAREMARTAEDHARHFTHPGRARDDAVALFWQVAPAAFADPATFAAAHLDPDLTAERMLAAIKSSPLGPDFTAAPLPEQFFRTVAVATLTVMLNRAETVAALSPALWRESLKRQAEMGQAQADGFRASEERDREMLAILRRLDPQATRSAHAAGVTDERILGLARRIVADVPDLDRAFAEIERAVEVAIEVQTRGHAGSNTGDFVDAVLARMAALSAEGRDDEAAAEAGRAFAEWEERQKLEAQKGIALLDAGLRADILRRDAASAARRIARKLELEPPDAAGRVSGLYTEFTVWFTRGRDKGRNFDLEVSVNLARLAYEIAGNADVRGSVLNSLGNALRSLGERERGVVRLKEAVVAYHAALEERPRQRVPLLWAATQMDLGNALALLGERESGTAWLEQAIAAYRAALEERTRWRVPHDWAVTQMNLGNALQSLGVREGNTARLEQAVDAYRAALEEFASPAARRDWARTQMNLGIALHSIGEREPGTTRLKEAVAAYGAALEVTTRGRVPLEWAMVQVNLARALAMIADRNGEPRDGALSTLDAALEVFRAARADAYLEWAESVRASMLRP